MLNIKNILTVIMAGLLLTASLGITLHKHYCMGRLKHIAVFEKAESCMGMMGKESEDCPMNCCKDTAELFKVDDLKKVSQSFNLTPDLKLLATTMFLLVDLDLMKHSDQVTANIHYKPPLPDRDIPVLIQSFLI